MKIAILDDDSSQNAVICPALTSLGHDCHSFSTGEKLLERLRRDVFDLLILDWQLQGMSAMEILNWSREQLRPDFPVLFMISRSGEEDIIAAMAAGATEYMIKPIRRSEVVARVQALLRRTYPKHPATEQIQFGLYVFESVNGTTTHAEKNVEMTRKEFDLALLFFRNIGRPLSRTFIREAVWLDANVLPSRTMDTHVSRVRTKLALRPENGFRLSPVYGYGYLLEQF